MQNTCLYLPRISTLPAPLHEHNYNIISENNTASQRYTQKEYHTIFVSRQNLDIICCVFAQFYVIVYCQCKRNMNSVTFNDTYPSFSRVIFMYTLETTR
jgi:hypothetical protein